MNTTITTIPEYTLEKLADRYGLTMSVKERELPEGDPKRFYACFEYLDIKSGSFSINEYGDGRTPDEAIADYAPRLHLKHLIHQPPGGARTEIRPVRIRAFPAPDYKAILESIINNSFYGESTGYFHVDAEIFRKALKETNQ